MKREICLIFLFAGLLPTVALGASEKKFVSSKSLKAKQLEWIDRYIEEAAAQERLDPALIKAIVRVESNFNHKAVSPVGARGLMQLMPDTAQELGFRNALNDKKPRENIYAGVRYLRQMINEFAGDLRLAIAAYNAGPQAVKKYGGIPPYKETKNYVRKVLSMYDAFSK
jgi:soluble lytic murein transglycosylase-like protein